MAAGDQRAARWLFGPSWDLLLGCGLLYAFLLMVFSIDGPAIRDHQPHFLFPLLFLLIGAPHYGATLLRVYEQRAERQRYAWFAVWATLAIVAAFFAGLVNPWVGSWLLTIYLTWSPWHYTGQNYGLATMFLRRRASTAISAGEKRWLHASFILAYTLTFLLFHGSLESAPEPEFYSGEVNVAFRSLGIPVVVSRILFPVLAAAYLVVTATAIAVLRRRASWRDLQPTLLLVATQALWFPLPAALGFWQLSTRIDPLSWNLRTYYFFWIALGHSAQYLWITTYYARESAGFRGYSGYLGKALIAGVALWTLPNILLGTKFAGGAFANVGSVGLLVAACVNIHHFVLDGAIWKLRHSAIARILIRNVPAAPVGASGVAPAGRFMRRAVWSLAAFGFALAVFRYVHEDVLYARALSRQDWAEAESIMQRFAWIADVSPAAREQLARAQDEALRDRRQADLRLERKLGLLPSVAAYRQRAAAHEQQKDWQAAIDEYERALKLDPENVALLRGAGRAWLALHEFVRAREYLERAVELQPRNQGARDELRRVERLQARTQN